MAQSPSACRPWLLAVAMLFATLTAAAPAAAATEEPAIAEVEEQVAVSPPSPVRAAVADDVVESIGVNVHLGYLNTNYDNFEMVRQRLKELGVRYVRDHISQGREDVYSRMLRLAADGIRVNLIAGDPLQRWNNGTIDQQLDLIQREVLPAVASIEGPNEYDLQGDPNWAAVLRDYTQRLWEGVKSRPALAGLPVLGPSIVRRENMAAVGDLSSWLDYGNTHTYLSGDIPERAAVWDGELAAARNNSATKPVQVTETGYHNGINGTLPHEPASERATAIYMPRLLLENFKRGIVRSYSYELLDQRDDPTRTDIEAAFGLLRNDFSKKPAATAVERLIGLLSDRGPRFLPTSLAYRIEGDPPTAQELLLQKRNGTFYLLLWNRVSAWSTDNRTDVDPADVPVTVKLGQPIVEAEVFQPNVSPAPIAAIAAPDSIALNLSEQVTAIKLVPPRAVPLPQGSTPPPIAPAPPAGGGDRPAPAAPGAPTVPGPGASTPQPPASGAVNGSRRPAKRFRKGQGMRRIPALAPQRAVPGLLRPQGFWGFWSI